MKKKDTNNLMFGVAIAIVIIIAAFGPKLGLYATVPLPEDYAVYATLDNLIEQKSGTTMSVNGNPVQIAGLFGNAYHFDGTDDYLSLPSSADMMTSNYVTLEAWVYPEAHKHGYIISKTNSYMLQMWSNTTTQQSYLQGGIYHYDAATSTYLWHNTVAATVNQIGGLNQWYYVVFTYDTSVGSKLYINGNLVDSEADPGLTISFDNSIPFVIGNRYNYQTAGDRGFRGAVDEVVVYPRVLSATEVMGRYQATVSNGTVTPSNETNKITNPSFDVDASGWYTYVGGTAQATGARTTTIYDTAPAGYAITATTRGSSKNDIQFYAGQFAITSGTVYRLTFRARATESFLMPNIKIQQAISPWNAYTTEDRSAVITTSWKTFTLYYYTTTSASDARLNFYLGDTLPAGVTFYIDDVELVESSGPVCGNNVCDATENKDNCPYDCYDPVSGARELADLYRTPGEVYSVLKGMANNHPTLMSYETIGHTLRGKEILLFKVGNPNGGVFMFDGKVHGPEDCGTTSGIAFIDWVLNDNSQEAQDVRTNNYLLFIPMINIDTVRRQNMRRYYTEEEGGPLTTTYGVDLNRNFVTGWGGSGSSNTEDAYSYRGISAASEPETQAVRNAMQTYLQNDGHSLYVNIHCGGAYLNYYQNTAVTQSVIEKMAQIAEDNGVNTMNYYTPSGINTGGYVAADGAALTGGNGWLWEISDWDHLPASLSDYMTIWQPRAFPVYLAMAQAVAIPQSSTQQQYDGYQLINNACVAKTIYATSSPYNTTFFMSLSNCEALVIPTYYGYQFKDNACNYMGITTSTSPYNTTFLQYLANCQELIESTVTPINYTGFLLVDNTCVTHTVSSTITPFNATFLKTYELCHDLIVANASNTSGGEYTSAVSTCNVNSDCIMWRMTTNDCSMFWKAQNVSVAGTCTNNKCEYPTFSAATCTDTQLKIQDNKMIIVIVAIGAVVWFLTKKGKKKRAKKR